MKRLVSCLLGFGLIASASFAGVGYSGKEMKQVAAPPPCPERYADREFNVSLWGTYIFTGNTWENDRYLESYHAWGGGADLKYVFMRYIGVRVGGWAVSARRRGLDFHGCQVAGEGFLLPPRTPPLRSVCCVGG